MKIKKYAAIDIGSNAVRLLISYIIENGSKTKFKKVSLVRVPIRLGADVFVKGFISEHNKQRLLDAMMGFKYLMKAHEVDKYMAVATSAMREAKNGHEVVEEIKQKTGIDIQIIDGAKEAALIAATDLDELLDRKRTYLYVDVGGGSTEFSIFHNGKKVASKSFKLGTVRLLKNMVDKSEWEKAEQWVKSHTKNYDKVYVIGSGGNINKLFKMSGKVPGSPLSKVYLDAQYKFLKSMAYKDRIKELDMNPDRADVIIPAAKIYRKAMEWSGADKIYVPKIGLADGIIKYLYLLDKQSENHPSKNNHQ
ncbi:MAG TPA: exopolyphosphatase [Flavobacteriales bacterium]|jgi:exopolyphosphatase/guanosine-5'-triphosphate,3'-diphosphate pyrophosphatase|nr:exopolyphosphatase [Flavobacteriales bacterium]